MMYNADRDKGRQVELPLYSHYISGIMAENPDIRLYAIMLCSSGVGTGGSGGSMNRGPRAPGGPE